MSESPRPVRCIVGLGNPGERYSATLHNAGFWFVDRLAERERVALRAESKFHGQAARLDLPGTPCWLLEPTTFMNRSGQAVSALARFYRLEPADILVVHDELDLPPGTARLKDGGGHGGHNGLRDIVSALGSRDFRRLRLGIGHPGDKNKVLDYVLGRPGRDAAAAIDDALERALSVVPELLAGDWQKAVHRLHSPG